jgi:hypothetical protein
LGFVTERNTTVPLRVVSHDAVPDLTDQVLRADQAVKAELFTADRWLIIAPLSCDSCEHRIATALGDHHQKLGRCLPSSRV